MVKQLLEVRAKLPMDGRTGKAFASNLSIQTNLIQKFLQNVYFYLKTMYI